MFTGIPHFSDHRVAFQISKHSKQFINYQGFLDNHYDRGRFVLLCCRSYHISFWCVMHNCVILVPAHIFVAATPYSGHHRAPHPRMPFGPSMLCGTRFPSSLFAIFQEKSLPTATSSLSCCSSNYLGLQWCSSGESA